MSYQGISSFGSSYNKLTRMTQRKLPQLSNDCVVVISSFHNFKEKERENMPWWRTKRNQIMNLSNLVIFPLFLRILCILSILERWCSKKSLLYVNITYARGSRRNPDQYNAFYLWQFFEIHESVHLFICFLYHMSRPQRWRNNDDIIWNALTWHERKLWKAYYIVMYYWLIHLS